LLAGWEPPATLDMGLERTIDALGIDSHVDFNSPAGPGLGAAMAVGM
jgi:hypothetical protein